MTGTDIKIGKLRSGVAGRGHDIEGSSRFDCEGFGKSRKKRKI